MVTSKPNKSRKAAFTMPVHKKNKAIAGHLNEKLQKEIGRRSLPLRKNDTVKIVRGSFKAKTGKIIRIDRVKMKVFVEKVIRKKSDGTEFEVPIEPSNLIILEIDRSDRKRLKRQKEGKA
ncbi:MAG: 50S ribosomal protein L24 [Candidatus Diapherotrites archaeon]|jgi:large subunit ribosomal protein L24|nr:50S ribosomal protein L24 [Candidatus Diapherotrites archaeon]MBT4596657.1 50S ribosomal protein L24 [Candidatus Diapherotrites archaeon]